MNEILRVNKSTSIAKNPPNDLIDFDKKISEITSRVIICIENFDLAADRHLKGYDINFFACLRWMLEEGKLNILFISKVPLGALLPKDNPLSEINVKMIVLS